MGFYAGGFLLFWIPEQFLCGNQLLAPHERGPIQALTDLPVCIAVNNLTFFL